MPGSYWQSLGNSFLITEFEANSLSCFIEITFQIKGVKGGWYFSKLAVMVGMGNFAGTGGKPRMRELVCSGGTGNSL